MTAISTAVRHLDLRGVLTLDAIATAATGLLLAAGSGPLEEVLGIPSAWLLGLGLFLLAFAVDLAMVGALVGIRPGLRRFAPALVAANAAWVLASALVVLAGGFALTGLGVAFVLGQAAIVAGFAVLQARALRG